MERLARLIKEFDNNYQGKEDSINRAYQSALQDLRKDYQSKRSELVGAYDKVRVVHEAKLMEAQRA
jgi:hypothetical protein